MSVPGKLQVEEWNREVAGLEPHDLLQWAWRSFRPRIAATSSFQTQSLPLLHIIASTVPDLTVLFLDTGFHFPETLAFRDRVVRDLNLRLEIITPTMPTNEFQRRYGKAPWSTDPDRCCAMNKIGPMRQALGEIDGWISGIRRDQTAAREGARRVELGQQGTVRIHPLLDWTESDIYRYLRRFQLPSHPLEERGYHSIGCAPCTRPVQIDGEARSGRWFGMAKTECGLHTTLRSGQDIRTGEEA